MNKYEILYILDAKLDDAEKETLIERFKGIVETAGGSVEGVDKWGVKKLAYEINFKSEGYYVLMNFTAEANVPAEIERQMRITDGVMRFIVVRK
ncbi:MAG: 30S ribosomal protein S6 [Clostridia bacterium]|nr:30S ribosomal protein S6 [Clostridia bacterium]MBR6773722.1 30S ribosomal protein S6 [Clostridia bacterium]MBR7141063.1 30S ribosomal protein S6 [Clostridia bacterium]